jgi:HAD superfamily hydrolase (TIGR01509 family)
VKLAARAALKAIIFDVDGTLADTEEVHRQAFNATFLDFELDWFWTAERYRELLAVSGGRERMAFYAASLRPGSAGYGLAASIIAEIHQQKTARYAALLAAGKIRLRSGAERLLREALAAGVMLAIATSSARSNLETLLDLNLPAGWRDWFSVIESSDSTVEKKPSPAVYQAVLAKLPRSANECVVIEDTVNGLRAATSAGICTVITTHRYTRQDHFPGAALVVDGLGERGHSPQVLSGDLRGYSCVELGLLNALVAEEPAAAAAT